MTNNRYTTHVEYADATELRIDTFESEQAARQHARHECNWGNAIGVTLYENDEPIDFIGCH